MTVREFKEAFQNTTTHDNVDLFYAALEKLEQMPENFRYFFLNSILRLRGEKTLSGSIDLLINKALSSSQMATKREVG